MSDATVKALIIKWSAYRDAIAEPERYCQLKQDLYQVRNPSFNGSPPVTDWPSALVNPSDEIMASVEHYFLTRCWVGTGQYPVWEVRLLRGIYEAGKWVGVTPRHNPSRPVTPPSEMQRRFQDQGIRDGERDLVRGGKTAPKITKPPKYY